jgi:hypothetical protein
MYSKRSVMFFASCIVLSILSLIKIATIKGTYTLFFSGLNWVGPLIGLYGGFYAALALFLVRTGIRAALAGGWFLNPLALHIPTLCASWYLIYRSTAVRVGIPFLCVVLFNIHPVGQQAWFYSLYWVIPMVIHYLPRTTFFIEALGSTFTAHSVGTVVWLYCLSMSPEMFAMLMPIVIFERLLFASGITLVHYAIRWGMASRKSRQIRNKTSMVA